MSETEPREERGPTQPWNTWGDVGRYALVRLTDFLFSEKSPLLLIAVLGVLSAYHLGYLLTLPVEVRAGAESPLMGAAEAVSSILGSKALSLLGWVFFAVALVVFVPTTRVLWQRIQTQGHELKRLRDAHMEGRVSSRNEKSIDEYDERMKQKFGESDVT